MTMITDYASLITVVVDESHRTDLAAKIPRFIQLTESKLFNDVTLKALETSVTGTSTGGVIPLPVSIDAIQRITINTNGREYPLDYTSPNGVVHLTSGVPLRYTVEDGEIKLTPATAYNYTLHYIPKLTALSDSNTTNDILLNYPDVYLSGCLHFIGKHSQDPNLEASALQSFNEAIDRIRRKNERQRLPVSGGLQIKPRGYR